ncbi:hypothetical protein SynA1825c_02023 [Synechococcus sp. A18-25c]|nr:hypothetical protein SynA1825c_02023 [Synechococcus sp. A18-25c]
MSEENPWIERRRAARQRHLNDVWHRTPVILEVTTDLGHHLCFEAKADHKNHWGVIDA